MLFTKENVENAEANLAQRIEIVEGLQKIREVWHKDGWDVEIATCAEDIDLEKYGIEHNRCIDGELMKRIFADDKGTCLLSTYIEITRKRTCLVICHQYQRRCVM